MHAIDHGFIACRPGLFPQSLLAACTARSPPARLSRQPAGGQCPTVLERLAERPTCSPRRGAAAETSRVLKSSAFLWDEPGNPVRCPLSSAATTHWAMSAPVPSLRDDIDVHVAGRSAGSGSGAARDPGVPPDVTSLPMQADRRHRRRWCGRTPMVSGQRCPARRPRVRAHHTYTDGGDRARGRCPGMDWVRRGPRRIRDCRYRNPGRQSSHLALLDGCP